MASVGASSATRRTEAAPTTTNGVSRSIQSPAVSPVRDVTWWKTSTAAAKASRARSVLGLPTARESALPNDRRVRSKERDVDGQRARHHYGPGNRQRRVQDVRDLPARPVALDDLLDPQILDLVRQAVDEHQGEVGSSQSPQQRPPDRAEVPRQQKR